MRHRKTGSSPNEGSITFTSDSKTRSLIKYIHQGETLNISNTTRETKSKKNLLQQVNRKKNNQNIEADTGIQTSGEDRSWKKKKKKRRTEQLNQEGLGADN
jgi:hypothetical protein